RRLSSRRRRRTANPSGPLNKRRRASPVRVVLPPRQFAQLPLPPRPAPLALFPRRLRPPLQHPPPLPRLPPLPPLWRLSQWLSLLPARLPGAPRGALRTPLARGGKEIFQSSRHDSLC